MISYRSTSFYKGLMITSHKLTADHILTLELDEQPLELNARDGYTLATTWVCPKQRPKTVALIGPATGAPRRFYVPFARYLAQRGIASLIIDYRGVAGSMPTRLKGFEATKLDWGRLDMSAALDWIIKRYPNTPRVVIGHSVGAHLVGLMDNAHALHGVISVCSSFGYWGNMQAPYKYFVWSMFNLGIPTLTNTLGYFPAKRLGLGEDLPAGVALQWARWGRRPDYFSSDVGDAPGFKALNAPWLAILVEDDPIATIENATPLYACFPHSSLEVRSLSPSTYDLKAIGHIGFFAKDMQPLWSHVTRWLSQALVSA